MMIVSTVVRPWLEIRSTQKGGKVISGTQMTEHAHALLNLSAQLLVRSSYINEMGWTLEKVLGRVHGKAPTDRGFFNFCRLFHVSRPYFHVL